MCTSCFRVWKTEAVKKHLEVDGLTAAAGAGMETGECWPASAGRGDIVCRKTEICSVKKNGERVSAGWRRKQRYCLPKKCAPRVFAPEKFALAFFCLPAEFCSAILGSRCGVARKYKAEKNWKNLLRWRKIRHIVYIRN